MNSYKKYLQDEKRIKRWSICCWVSDRISWIIQQKYIQWIYQNLRYTKFGREFSIVFYIHSCISMSIKFISMAKSILFRKRIERKYTSNNDLPRVKRIEEIIKILV